MLVQICPVCKKSLQCVACSGVVVAKCSLCSDYIKHPVCKLTSPALKRVEGELCKECKQEAENAVRQ